MKTCKWTAINKSLCNLYKPSCEKIVMALPEGTIDEKERNEVTDFFIYCPRCGKKVITD